VPGPGEALDIGRERVKNAMGLAKDMSVSATEAVNNASGKIKETAKAGASSAVEYFQDDEKGTARKAVAAGVLSVATVAAA
jgi:hypothetical protein